jgi:hypothetical protein
MARAMRDEAYREAQWAQRYTGRVAAVNRFIDELGSGHEAGHPPYVPPICLPRTKVSADRAGDGVTRVGPEQFRAEPNWQPPQRDGSYGADASSGR